VSVTIKPGDFVVAPFGFSDGTCLFCHDGIHTPCIHGGFYGVGTDSVAVFRCIAASCETATLIMARFSTSGLPELRDFV